jgi:hypothetical protein
MEKVSYPVGEKLLAGKTSILAFVDFDSFTKNKAPEKIVQCMFYNTVSGKQKIVDLFRPSIDFPKYAREFNLAACSLQNM